MNSMKFSEAMSELDSKYVDEALSYKKKARKPVWVKLGVLAACLAIVIAIGGILAPFSNCRFRSISVWQRYCSQD